MEIILASASGGRQQILQSLQLKFTVIASNIDEDKISDQNPINTALLRAFAKGQAVAKKVMTETTKPTLIIAADTVGFLHNWQFGKPKNHAEAVIILKRLSGKTHWYVTGHTLITNYELRIKKKEKVKLLISSIFSDGLHKITKSFVSNTKAGVTQDKVGNVLQLALNCVSSTKVLDQWSSGIYLAYDLSSVTFRQLSMADIRFYLQRVHYTKLCAGFQLDNSPQNFVTATTGSISNIIGLSIEKLLPALMKINYFHTFKGKYHE